MLRSVLGLAWHGCSDFSKMKMKALKLLLKERGVKCDGCTDKSDFVKMVKESIDMPVLSKKKGGAKRNKQTNETLFLVSQLPCEKRSFAKTGSGQTV